MLRAVLVEDEPEALSRYSGYVSAYGNGFSLAATFRNAAAAFDFCRLKRLDVLITDIRMPGESGLTLLSKLRAVGWDGAAVIISGYDEFEYARAAIGLKVHDYLLKPVFEEDMHRCLDSVLASYRGRLEAGEAPEVGEKMPACVRSARAFVELNLNGSVSLAEAARYANVTPAYLSRVFHTATGMTFVEYVHARKIRAADELFSESRCSVEEAAVRLGFSDASYFCKVYKRVTGRSPGRRSATITRYF